MKITCLFTAIPMLLVVASSAHAVLVGDKDWLQVTATSGYSWNNIDAIFDTSTGQCDTAGCLLGGTVDLTGYIWASNAEVDSLFQSYNSGIGLLTLNNDSTASSGSVTGLDSFFSDFAFTEQTSSRERILGWTRNSSIGSNYGDFIEGYNAFTSTADNHRLEIHLVSDYTDAILGGWFYAPVTVPIPATVWLFSSGLLGLIGVSRRKKTD